MVLMVVNTAGTSRTTICSTQCESVSNV